MGDGQNCDSRSLSYELSGVVVSREEIAYRVAGLGEEITEFYGGDEVTILPVLTGAFVFTADLVRQLSMKIQIDPISVSSYPGTSTTSQGCSFRLPPPENLHNRNVLIVDDIFDSGATMDFLINAVSTTPLTSLRTCALLRKQRDDLPERRNLDFVGFDIRDEFVVGYGLDFDGFFRNLPDICVLRTCK
ncbi:MAG: hypoxanthine phosphoribosyltransferase [Phycisphaerae bacterium]|nr:hypoxanthine phosphoribosyltransferase [Phycisphaerae bacterium]